MDKIRKLRIEECIRKHIMSLIIRGSIKDPRVDSGVGIIRTSVFGDLSVVRVYVSHFSGHSEKIDAVCNGLNSASGFVRASLGKILKSRNTPKPIFFPNTGTFEDVSGFCCL